MRSDKSRKAEGSLGAAACKKQEADRMMQIDDTLIQHGKSSDRIYLMRLGTSPIGKILTALEELAEENRYGKIFAKIPESKAADFLKTGYHQEARIPGLFRGEEAGFFLCRYYSSRRRQEEKAEQLDHIVALAKQKADGSPPPLGKGKILRTCIPDDAEAAAAIYGKVFASYPFPIDDPEFIRSTMADHVLYAGIEKGGELISMASAEMYPEDGCAEMTDFATPADKRGSGYAFHLLGFLEEKIRKKGILTAYTIARAASPGMNITFARRGYHFAGRLIKNTDIAGTIESMNVWYRSLK